ncbi:MAG: hypothetical protein JW776_04115 [Candidatus Lokiarchaeota archaeon]|nr:hypothetical protein [Candidatus Lokiarchaeota archaeon]
MAKKGIGGVITGSIVLFLGAIIITAGVGGRVGVNTFLIEPYVGEAFNMIEEMAIPEIKKGAYADFLSGVKDAMVGAFGGPGNLALFVNGSTSMQVVGQVIGNLAGAVPTYYGNPLFATWGVFNDTIQAFYTTPIKGVIEWAGVPLTYTLNDAINLTQGSSLGLPGFLEPDPLGDGTPGMLAFLGVYANPSSAGFPDVPTLATVGYGLASGTHLDLVAGWITTELFNFVPYAIGSQVGWAVPPATAATAEKYILVQWAEKALIPAGLGTLDPLATNFEVGTDFTDLAQVEAVWASVTDTDDLDKWFNNQQSTLTTELTLVGDQYTDIRTWLDTVEPTVQAGVAANFGFPANDVYLRMLLGQWMDIGFLQDEPLAPGFEIDLPPGEILDSDTALAVWNSLTDDEGLKKWYAAVDNRYGPEFDELQEDLGLSTDLKVDLICNYLETWRSDTIFVLGAEYDMLPELPIWGTDIKGALDDLELYLPIGGGVFAVAGILMIALFARKRA